MRVGLRPVGPKERVLPDVVGQVQEETEHRIVQLREALVTGAPVTLVMRAPARPRTPDEHRKGRDVGTRQRAQG